MALAATAVVAAEKPPNVQPLRLRVGDVNPAAVPAASDGGPVVVQLSAPATPERRAALTRAGARLHAYLPRHALLADISDADRAAVGRLPFVARIGDFPAAWRIDPRLAALRRAAARRSPADETLLRDFRTRVGDRRTGLLDAGSVRVAVSMLADCGSADARARVGAIAGVSVQRAARIAGNTVLEVAVPLAALDALSRCPGVQFIEDAPAPVLRNATTVPVVQSGNGVDTPIWDRGLHGEGQIVGLIDTTPRFAHCMFDDAVAIGPTHRKFISVYPDPPYSAAAHGTFVAGVLAGDSGTVGLCESGDGVACAARLVFTDLSEMYVAATNLADRLVDAHSNGARIHSNSWGDDGTTAYTLWCQIIDDFSYTHEEDLVIFASTNLPTLRTPENAKNVLAVGASGQFPNHELHCYGGAGPTADGRRKPEVFAPGCTVRSAAISGTCDTRTWSGTSFAAPAIAGTAALVRQYFLAGYYPDGESNPAAALTPSGALLKAVLLNAARDMTLESGYPSEVEGWGRLVLDRALHFVGETRRLIVRDVRHANGLHTGERDTVDVMVWDSAEALRVTLVFTDPPATAGAADPVVNDLNLVVTSANGVVYYGNTFASGQSIASGSADPRNNVEQVSFSVPDVGAYFIEVVAEEVNSPAPQGYALVVTGAVIAGAHAPPVGFGDVDVDGDRDLRDFAAFQACFAGAGVPYADAACAVFDVDTDGDVDEIDFVALRVLFTGTLINLP